MDFHISDNEKKVQPLADAFLLKMQSFKEKAIQREESFK